MLAQIPTGQRNQIEKGSGGSWLYRGSESTLQYLKHEELLLKGDHWHSLTQLCSAGCFHPMYDLCAEARAQSAKRVLLPPHAEGMGKAGFLPSPPSVLWFSNLQLSSAFAMALMLTTSTLENAARCNLVLLYTWNGLSLCRTL